MKADETCLFLKNLDSFGHKTTSEWKKKKLSRWPLDDGWSGSWNLFEDSWNAFEGI